MLKRTIALFLLCAIMVTGSSTVYAADTSNDTATQIGSATTDEVMVYGEKYTVSVEKGVDSSGQEYYVSTVANEDGSDVSIADSRYNYILVNGKKIEYSISDVIPTLASTPPTTIDHDYVDVIHERWGYMYSNWSNYQLETTLVNAGVSGIVALLTMKLGKIRSVATSIALSLLQSCSANDDAFYIRTYWYGDSYVMGRKSWVTQYYTENYTPLHGPGCCSIGPGMMG